MMTASKPKASTAGMITAVAVAWIACGVFCLCQPWSMALYRNGFQVLLVGTLTYIVSSHLE